MIDVNGTHCAICTGAVNSFLILQHFSDSQIESNDD